MIWSVTKYRKNVTRGALIEGDKGDGGGECGRVQDGTISLKFKGDYYGYAGSGLKKQHARGSRETSMSVNDKHDTKTSNSSGMC